jgi:hypothetical protein
MGEYKFIFASIIFIIFMFWFQTQLGVAVVSGDPNLTLAIPNCTSTNPIGCSISWVGFLFSLSFLESSFLFLNAFIIAMVGSLIYIGVKLVRGGG